MGTGWRRAFCTRDPESTLSDKQHSSHSPSPSPRSCARLNFFSGGSNPSTPRLQQQQSQPVNSPSLRCRTLAEAAATVNESPRFQSKTTPRATKSPKTVAASNPNSPRSPLKLSLFKNSFKFRSSCGICLNSVKTGQGTAIYTAECSHAFHFPCIAAHVRKRGSLICPVCNAVWKDVPLLAAHKNLGPESTAQNDVAADKPNASEKKRAESPSPVFQTKNLDPPQQQPQSQAKHSDSVRAYDDDEPLLSPIAGGRIIPIPEADENAEDEEDDDVGEFQGFFVTAKPSSSVKSYSDDVQASDGDSRTVQVKLMPECAVVSVSRSHETYALVLKVKAPPARSAASSATNLDSPHRAPIDLVTVLDLGGSMTGAKLHMLKRAMRLVISSLGSADRLSIVAFSATSKRLFPLRRMTANGQRLARRIVDRLVTGQGTAVSDALKKATKVLEDRRERNPVASVMLLSDGQDERVQNNSNKSSNQRKTWSHVSSTSTRFAHIEIPVHAFGFGAKSGYSNDPGEDAFAKCVGGLLSVVVQDLRIQLGFQSDSGRAEISAIYTCSGRPTLLSSGAVRLGDLYAEEERELLVELRVPSWGVGSHHVMTVRCLYKDPGSQEIVYGKEQGLVVPSPQSLRSGTRIERLRNLFITTRAVAESRRVLEQNADFTSAHHLLASARALLVQSGSASAAEYVRGLEAELAEVHWRRQQVEQVQVQIQQQQQQRRRGSDREVMSLVDENGEPLTPTSAWRAAEKLAKMAMIKKSLNRVSDLHGFENARF
ncbi:E3 ubiquitin-protein ligase WAV3 [Lotus japonicus]|uniref:E3 ubiquitin-protein ligase WAV3 n=1 Tax=Lotus japonicus TaxID=34305 RepID=UPI0025835524|nr:E3 ubiquitin-protein ligase WAV3 [Lotus japonicus]XP_057434868.1 E3 ubiquitin-protein ligase WAV3 [Lotus japonicus]